MENKIVILENNKNYDVVDTILYNGSTYLILCNEVNYKDIIIRKLEKKDNEDFLSRLKEDEFNILINLFLEKNNTLQGNNF